EAYRQSATLAEEGEQHGETARALIHAAIAAERDNQTQTATTLLASALTHLEHVPDSYDKASEWLLVGRAYHRLSTAQPTLILPAADAYRKSADIAQALKDQRTLSYARGYLGRLYEDESRYPDALALTRRAVTAAQQVPESLYQWEWQTGRLLQAMGQAQPALHAYERAIETVQSIRTALLRRQRREHLSFRQTLGPLYFEYANLLLRKAEALSERKQAAVYPQHEIYLHLARAAVEQFKTQELRDYFGDECVDAAHQRTVTIDYVSPDAVVLYPILLPDRTELLVSLPSELKREGIPVSGADLEQRVRVFRNALEARDPRRYLRHAQRLYSWLIQPIEAELKARAIQTIVFVPDGALRLLPIAALHDGQQYLIETYAVSVTPSLTLTEPQSLSRHNLNVLVAGLTESVAGFPALPRVAEEVRNVQQIYGAKVLLDQEFSPERLQQTIQEGDFGIVHIAAHGHFAPDAADSFLLTGQGKLTFDQLTQIVGQLRFRKQPLELLTLSACETAHGDDRAALGLAGIAIQAGARSALATLWRVQDAAATRLMTSFYQHLQDPTMSRARALQQAQLGLLKDAQHSNPFFWAPFLLINNWL
ncbi:MAG: CHAT domain-containing protein, partial [Candidatus Tectomicrobia bacterium]|nr:CHAT domain-containing protein [Candidatus Tectomicrobia bacterium]